MAASLYLYCLREPAETKPESPAPSGIKLPAIDGGRVFCCVFDGIEAVISEVNFDDFGEMQKKAQEDIHWIKEKALAHEAVVEEAMGKNVGDMKASNGRAGQPVPPACIAGRSTAGRPFDSVGQGCPTLPNLSPVIPVKFGMIFNTEERLAQVIGEQSKAIKTTFARIRAKQEWSVKLFIKDNQKFKDQVREQSELFREKSKTLAALPAGMAYFMEEELNEELERECSRRLEEEAMKTFEELKPFAAEATLVKILDSKLTGRSERMVLNSAYLVADIHLPEFENAAAKLREQLGPEGFLVEQSGPWPAYHFTEFELEGTEAQRQKAQRDGGR